MDELFGARDFGNSAILDEPYTGEDFPDAGDLNDLGFDEMLYDDEFPDE